MVVAPLGRVGAAADAGRARPPRSVRSSVYHPPIPRRFADTAELSPQEALGAPLRSPPRPSRLAEPLGLDGRAAEAAAALGLRTVGDLLEHLPRSHRDRTEARTVADLAVGEEATVCVTVRSVDVRPMRDRRRKRVEARVADDTGPLLAVWFNQPWVARGLEPGARVLLHGRLRRR